MHYRTTWKTRGMCFALGYAVFYFMRDYVSQLMFKLLYNNVIWTLTDNFILDTVLFFMFLMVPITMIHEWVHGMVYKLFGYKIKHEIKGIYMTTEDISGIPIHRSKFILVMLAPLTVISLLSLLISGWIGGMVLLLNIFKSTGDLLKVFFVFKGNSKTHIINRKDGFDIVNGAAAVQLTFDNLQE